MVPGCKAMIPKLLLYWAMPATALHLVTASLMALQQTPAPAAAAAPQATVNTPRLPIAPDAAADTLLVDLRTLDPMIRIDPRYATPNNFTGKPLPGYQARRAPLPPSPPTARVRAQATR